MNFRFAVGLGVIFGLCVLLLVKNIHPLISSVCLVVGVFIGYVLVINVVVPLFKEDIDANS